MEIFEMKTFVIAIATLLPTCVATVAQAASDRDVQQQVVSYSDLELGSEAGSAILRARIESAARDVCGLRRDVPLPIELRVPMQKCTAQARARALAELNAGRVSQRGEIVVTSKVAAR
jgi:UrcA family protein